MISLKRSFLWNTVECSLEMCVDVDILSESFLDLMECRKLELLLLQKRALFLIPVGRKTQIDIETYLPTLIFIGVDRASHSAAQTTLKKIYQPRSIRLNFGPSFLFSSILVQIFSVQLRKCASVTIKIVVFFATFSSSLFG